MSKAKNRRGRLTVRIPVSMTKTADRKVRALARRGAISRAAVIRKAIDAYTNGATE